MNALVIHSYLSTAIFNQERESKEIFYSLSK